MSSHAIICFYFDYREPLLPRWKNSLQTNQDIQRLKREAVLKEAGRAFAKRGYHNTSLDEVAKALQVSKGTLYNYVKDKQEILYECHKLALDIGDRAFEFEREQGMNGAEILRHTMTRYITLLTEELGACSVLTEVDALHRADRTQVVKRRDAFERSFIAIIELGIKDGSIRPVDPKLAVFTFMGAFNWLPRWYSPEGRLTGEQIGEQMADLLMSGLHAEAGPRPKGVAAKPPRAARKKPAKAG